jgi:hypothetical protein
MSLTVSIPTDVTLVTQPAQSVELHGEITIQRVVDLPTEKKVFVFTKELGKIDLPSLSNANYDNPNEWTNADVVLAVQEYVNSLLPPTSEV